MFKFLILTILSPFLSNLSLKVEGIVSGNNFQEAKATKASYYKELQRSIKLNVRNLVREIVFSMLVVILGGLTPLSVFVPILLFIISSYYLGVGLLGYAMERHLNYQESIRFIKEYPGAIFGLGAILLILFSIPIIGILMGPTVATIASTLFFICTRNKS